MFELEQRLIAVERELHQVKQGQQQAASQARNTPLSNEQQGAHIQQQGIIQPSQQIQSQQPSQHMQPHFLHTNQTAEQRPLPGYQPPYPSATAPYNIGVKKQSGNMESVLVKIVLPIVFIIVLLIGVLMLFIAGVAYGLITEPIRCLLGLLVATGMYVVGMLQHSYKRPIWGKSLLGGAHGIFIITVSVAHLSYELIGTTLASLLYLIAFGLITFSALRWHSQLLVTIAIISGYLCMFLIDITTVHAMPFIIIQLVFSISMLLLSMKLSYRYAYCFAYMLLHLSLLVTYGVHEYVSPHYLLFALIAQHFVVFIQFVRQKVIQVEQIVAQFAGSIILISWTSQLYNTSEGISWVYSAVTLFIAISYACALLYFERVSSAEDLTESNGNQKGTNSAGLEKTDRAAIDQKWLASIGLRTEFSAIIIAFSLFCFFGDLLGASFTGLVLLLIGVSLLLFGLRDDHRIMSWFGAGMTAIGVVSIVFDWPTKLFSYEVLSWLLMLASIFIVYRECRQTFADHPVRFTLLPSIVWSEVALLFIFVTIIGSLIGESISEDAESYMVSLSWLLYAIGAIILGSIKQLKQSRMTGIILLLVIVVKLIFIDMTFLNILSKSIMFTVVGIIGIVVSFILYNRTDEK